MRALGICKRFAPLVPAEQEYPTMRDAPGFAPLVLLVEDQTLIAMSLAASLEDDGFRICGPFGSVAEALDSLRRIRPDAAVLDVQLADGSSERLAAALRAMSIPFVVYSGSGPRESLPAVFAEAPWISKPAPRDAVKHALVRAGVRPPGAPLDLAS
jgi:ActR/RegA family two-component response regulator